jgi:alpha-N-arabinofuranosidase
MLSRNYLPRLVKCAVTGADGKLDVVAKRSDDGKTLVLQAVNPTDRPIPAQIRLAGFVPKKGVGQTTELSGPLDAVNTAARPRAVVPQSRPWEHATREGSTSYTFLPYSVTVLRLE